tara:strand:- start:75 stop:197 length:123 start_codon:yes stop_codon:yes gene_type:complete
MYKKSLLYVGSTVGSKNIQPILIDLELILMAKVGNRLLIV